MRSIRHKIKMMFSNTKKTVGKTTRLASAARELREKKNRDDLEKIFDKLRMEYKNQIKEVALTDDDRFQNALLEERLSFMDYIEERLDKDGKS